jgi:hypothetical protein
LSGSIPPASTRTSSCQRCSPSPSSATAHVGFSVVSCSGRATNSSSSGIGGPPGAPATWRASHPSTCCTNAHGSRKAGFAVSRSTNSLTAPVSIGLCRKGESPNLFRRLGVTTSPTGWTWSSHSRSGSRLISVAMTITPKPARDRQARPVQDDVRAPGTIRGCASALPAPPAPAGPAGFPSAADRPPAHGAPRAPDRG